MNIEIANRLVKLRKENGLSQEALADKLGISRQAVSKWERAEASPDTDNLILLARLYRVSLDELLRTEDGIPEPGGCTEGRAAESTERMEGRDAVQISGSGSMAGRSAAEGHATAEIAGAVSGFNMAEIAGTVSGFNMAEITGTVSGFDMAENPGTVGSRDVAEIPGTVGGSDDSQAVSIGGKREDAGARGGAESHKFAEEGQGAGQGAGYAARGENDWKSGKQGEDVRKDKGTGEESQEYVQLGFKGIHVLDKDGSEVHVGWDGIHVDDRKKGNGVHIDKAGVYVNGEKYDRKWYEKYHGFPIAPFIVLLYFFIGVFLHIWHPTWMLFLLIPLWYSFLGAVKNRNPYIFAYPVLVTLVFLTVGFFFDAWHPGWVVFLTVPVYYPVVSYFTGKADED